MSFELQPKYVTCKIDVEKLFSSVVMLLKSYKIEKYEEKEFGLVFNEDLEIYEIRYLGLNMQDNIIKNVFGIIEEQDFTNIILKRFFNIEEGKGCIQFHYDYLDKDNYYYILMPYETFQSLQIFKK
ncbi:hypothetical protein [Clostridium sp.]